MNNLIDLRPRLQERKRRRNPLRWAAREAWAFSSQTTVIFFPALFLMLLLVWLLGRLPFDTSWCRVAREVAQLLMEEG